MEDVLRSRGLYQITLGKETEPIDDDKKTKSSNKCDEAHGLIGMSILWLMIPHSSNWWSRNNLGKVRNNVC